MCVFLFLFFFFITTKAKTVHPKETDRWYMKLPPAKHIHTKYESTTKLNDWRYLLAELTYFFIFLSLSFPCLYAAGGRCLTGGCLMPQTEVTDYHKLKDKGTFRVRVHSVRIEPAAALSQTPSSHIDASEVPSPIHSACNWNILGTVHSCPYHLCIAAKEQNHMY